MAIDPGRAASPFPSKTFTPSGFKVTPTIDPCASSRAMAEETPGLFAA